MRNRLKCQHRCTGQRIPVGIGERSRGAGEFSGIGIKWLREYLVVADEKEKSCGILWLLDIVKYDPGLWRC
jgi:hypothetical protein